MLRQPPLIHLVPSKHEASQLIDAESETNPRDDLCSSYNAKHTAIRKYPTAPEANNQNRFSHEPRVSAALVRCGPLTGSNVNVVPHGGFGECKPSTLRKVDEQPSVSS